MFGWSPPNILATLVLFYSLLLHCNWSPTQAKPYPKQDLLSTYTTGSLGGLNERDWPELINYKNGDYIERDKRSPTEVEDESPNSSGDKTLTVKPRKRQGIETPIQPLTSDSGLGKDTLSHLNTDENVRSKVDQPDSESTGVPVEEEKKTSDDRVTESSSAEHQQESKENVDSSKLKSEESNEGQEKEHDSSSKENANSVQIQQGESGQLKTENNGINDKADSSSESINDNESTADKNSANVQESKVESSKPVDENAQVRSVQESADEVKKLRNLPNDKNTVILPGSSSQLGNSPANTIIAGSKANPQEAQTLIKNNVNKQVNGDETKISTEKGETPVTTTKSRDQNTAAPGDNSAENSQAKTQSSPQESAEIHTVPQIRNVPVGPVRDALGNSGSEIVTTRGASDLDSYAERDTQPKPTNGPEVGHFQVDDKSADLEINANSAGVKVKAKPASLQVVSRPGSHSSSAAAQERSFYHHYHYPPYHPHHHWYPGMRRSYGHFHRSHFYNPYHSFPERRGFESFYDEAPFYRRHMHYWYPHRHRHHFHDSDLYERSRMEEPDDYPKYHGRRRHKRRFRHMNGPYRRQFYNNIPIMNGMESPQMGMIPEEGTMPQLPIGGGVPFTQRQNIMTPMPAPINVVGNPPPGLLGGVNAPNFALNGMNGLNSFNGANQMNNLNAFSGISDMNNMGAMGLNSLGPMGAMEGLPGGINTGMQGMAPPEEIPVTTRALGSRNSNSPSEAPRMAFKKTAILSSNKSATKEQSSNDQKPEPKKDNIKAQLNKPHGTGKMNKGKVNLKSWEKTLKRYHRLNVFTSKTHERHQFRRNAKSDGKKTEKKEERKHSLSHPRAQHPKDVKGNRKNAIVMQRPPIIYHPPPEIYHRPDIVVHRAPIMLHRPPIIYHQPPVVVHRPAIIYHQPPIVFHQPPPVVHQPILHSHDTWVTKPMVYHTASMVSHAKTYYGIPSHVYSGEFGEGCHGAHCSYRKGKVPHSKTSQAKNSTHQDHTKKTKRDSFSDYMAYFTSLWKRNGLTKRGIDDQYDFITSTDGSKEKLTYRNMDVSVVNKRDIASEHNSWIPKVRRETEKEESEDSKEGTQKKKKKDVVVNRPPIIYHPPPEIYHRPDIVVHRPPLVIHRPPIIYHQPPVIVHRPAVVYHQPPIVFHQPPPAVSQPLLYSHDSFTVHPSFYATHHGSVVRDFGHYVGVPNVITNYGNPLFGRPPPIGKRSKIEGSPSTENATVAVNDNSTAAASKRASLDEHDRKAKNETSEKAGKKNTVIVRRPPIIYHPPPEIYHRPIIVVHRPPIMIHRAPIFYHQPPVVVHRPAIVYHQPPLIFHQPPPMVHQPVLKSHDTWISHPVVTPYSSRVLHHHTYVGVPDAYTVHHFGGHGNSFYKSHILKHTKSFVEKASARNEISGDNKSTKSEKDSSQNSLHDRKGNVTSKLKTKKATSQKGGKKNAVILRRPPVIYHPPPEIYHRPEIVVHRAPIVIHRAPIIYHQPPVIVHRPAIVYHQPAIIFHQPPPVIHQPVFRSHDTYVHRPVVRLYGSRIHHVGHMYHIPHAYYHGHGGIHYMAYGKSKVPQKEHIEEEKGDTRGTVKGKKGHRKSKTEKTEHNTRRKHIALTRSKDKTETGTKLHKNHRSPVKYHKAKEVTEKANKKNSVVIHRPPIIYHPPPEIYHRPDIVVHRAPIVLYRAPIIYHQPPVVVHRPAIVYHQPPIVFHQPPPMVHQPVLHSHDTWVTKPVVIPYASHVRHVATYKGVPHEEIFMHGIGTGAFGKSRVPMTATRRNKVEGKNQDGDEETKTTTQFNKPTDETKNPETKHADDAKQNKESNTKLGAGERITRALTDSLIHKQWKNRNPVGAATRIQRSLPSLLPEFDDQVASRYSSEFSLDSQGYDEIPEEDVAAATRIQRSIDGVWSPYTKPLTHGVTTHTGAGARIQRALADPWTTFEGEKPYEMYKRSSEENQTSTPDENADKNTNSTKKTLLIIHRPPILYHPPSHMIHRPSIVVHRPDIIVHRHPIIFHRPPILMHRPPIIIHRQPVLIHRPPIIVHRPPLVFHRPPIIIHRRPYIIHHHPIIFHRPPLFIHKGPQMIVHHSHLIHHYPMHMIHMHCPGCGFGKSTVARLEDNSTEHDNKKTSHSDRSLKDSTVADSEGKSSNKPKRSVADKKSKKSSMETDHHRKKKDGHKKKKDVVVNRPPIIYHPPPEVYHRPDIVVHRAPILIHRPPIVYHQPPVVVHRPAVVYHQPPIVFHQPAPAVNQPVLYSHDSFVVHPMAFASHMGSVVNDAGHYVGLPHGGVTNFPGNIPHGPTGHLFPTLNQAHWARRTEVSKPQDGKHAKINHEKHREHKKRSSELKDDQNGKGEKLNVKPTQQKSKHTKGERKNKVIVARPPMIYHPPPEIYDRPDIVVHRPDIVIHRPSIVYHQPSVVVHRAPVVYQQPPVVFHQPAPMVKQPIYNAHDTYVAHPVFHPQESHIAHSATYVGAPHLYPGHNDYGWGLSGHVPTVPTPQYHYASNYGYSGLQGHTPSPAYGAYGYSSYGPAFGRSEVESGKNNTSKQKDKEKHNKKSTMKKDNKVSRKRRSAELSKRHFHHHHHHHHHSHHHRHNHHHHGTKRFYHLRPISGFAHRGHRKHVVIIHRPPLIYHPPPQVYRQPDILMHLPPLVYHRPTIIFRQPPTIVHHPSIIYHQPPVVFHNPPPIIHTPMIHSHEILTPHFQHIMLPTSSYVHPAGNYFGPVVQGAAYGKSHIERTDSARDSTSSKSVIESEEKGEAQKTKPDKKRETTSTQDANELDSEKAKKRNVDLVVHQPPIVYHPPPDIFDKPTVVMHPPPLVVHRPPILIHRAPVVVHRPPVIIHRPPIVLHHPTPVYHVAHGHFFHPMGLAFGKSSIADESTEASEEDTSRKTKQMYLNSTTKEKSKDKKGERKNLVVVHRPPMIYHPPPEIYNRPDVVVHRPDIVVHRPSIVYHQPSVVVHRPPIIYHQPPIVFHQPPPMIHQPIMHAHDTYLAHPVPVPYTSQVQHAATYVGAPHYFHHPQFGGYVSHAFGKSAVEKVDNKTTSEKGEHSRKKTSQSGDKQHTRLTRDTANDTKTQSMSSQNSKGHKKNKVIIARPPMIYHPPPEIYDRPNIIVHRPDIVIHRPSIVYHQPSVVVHRPPVIYQQPPVVFHQPSPLVHQPIMHAHDTYVAHPVPVPYSSHVEHTSTYVGSPHHYPGGWNYGWSQPHPFGPAFGKSKVPKTNSKSSKGASSKASQKDKVKRAAKGDQGINDKETKPKSEGKSKKKNQVIMQRAPLIYHPPPEIYHKPDVVMHRPDIVIHRPSVVYHQPSVVVHRPPVIYQQPPVVFHQPSPMVNQPVVHAHDTYLPHPYFMPYSSNVFNGGSYAGAPHFYGSGWGMGGHEYGFGHAFGKSDVAKVHKKQKTDKPRGKGELKGSRRTLEQEAKNAEDAVRLKNETKTTAKGNKKNLVIMRRPPLIYHPPPEVYHKPDVIMHRPDIVIHRPSIVFHQPSVVVHRPPVIYHQPPVVFHQPSPMVHQPIFHSHDTYLAHPHFVPFTSDVHHAHSYVGAPHFYPGDWGWRGHGYGYGFRHAFGKSKVEKATTHHKKSKNDIGKESEGSRRTLHSTKAHKTNDKLESRKDESKGHKKNLVVMHRPPLIYHPPPEVYHRPDVIVHRPDIVIHRPSVVFHQPSVVVHRPPVIYHQPPVVFHQPSPMVHQPIFHSHETYLAHPHFVPLLSHVTHAGSYVGAPHFYPGHLGPAHGFGHFMGHAFYKSKVETGSKKEKLETRKKGQNGNQSTLFLEAPHNKTKRATYESSRAPETHPKSKLLKHIIGGSKKGAHNKDVNEKAEIKGVSLHPQKEDKKRHHKGHKKNMVVIQRPTLIYHPPPEIYDRPDVIVHRPDFVIHQPSVVYHQPSVVVHRPPIIYHPPPVVFHQPSPMVHQPMYTAHDMYHSHPYFVPYSSNIKHTQTYVGAPHYYAGGWRYGYGFSDNAIPQVSSWHKWNGFRGPWYPSSLYRTNYIAPTTIANRRVLRGPYPVAFSKSLVEKHTEKPEDSSKTHGKHSEKKHISRSQHSVRKGVKRNPRSVETSKSATTNLHALKNKLHKKGHQNGKGGKKNQVVLRRPLLVYHPPPEVYHRPDVIVHRPDIVIHQPSVVYHQPSVMVHRPPVIYNQPPVVFHQPAPMVNQPIFHAHESYMAHPAFVPFTSHIQHSGTYVGAPDVFHGGWNYGYGHAFGKSHVLKHISNSGKPNRKNRKLEMKTKIEGNEKQESRKGNILHPQEEKDEKPSRKNDIVVSRPPIIYHPPPEIYHRPDIVVHRAPIVLHRPPIIYHQPPVVVHRPAVVYHQPPIVFHQPPPAVNQPILHSHDSFILRPAARFLPQGSTVTHSMSYVGIPNHVVHGDELDFHHFHRSQIEHSGKSRSLGIKPQITKSTISKTPTTKTENTETTITDQTQKKTLRSTIHHHTLNKRQLMGSHSLYGPVSPINDIQDLHRSIETKEKLSTIPGKTSNREHEVAKRSDESGYDITKRQLVIPETTENVYHTSMPSVYNTLEAAALQNQALAETEGIPHSDRINLESLPGLATNLHAIQELEGAGIAPSTFPLSLQQYLPTAPKDDSPDVRVHVETTKSSIPLKKRTKRQLLPLYQQQAPVPVQRVLYQAPSLGGAGVIHATAPSSVYNLFNAYHPAYHGMTSPLNYLSMVQQLRHRPHVNINVQSARSTIPGHVLEKRSKDSKSKRQLLAIAPPVPNVIPFGFEGAGMIHNYPPYSPLTPLSRFSLPLLANLKYPDEYEPTEPAYQEALPLFHHYPQHIRKLYSTLPEDESSESPPYNPWASYLAALYNSFLGYPLYHSHHKPKVHVEVQASKSHIPKAIKTEKKHKVHSRAPITKRQLYNYIPDSSLTTGHYPLPTALNYGIQGIPFHHNSPRININVQTAKKNGIPSVIKQKRSQKWGSTKQREENKTGDKRDELVDGEQNDQAISANQGNSDFANAPENQFVATSETAQSEEGPTSTDEGQPQGQGEIPQQQPQEEMVGQSQELQQNSGLPQGQGEIPQQQPQEEMVGQGQDLQQNSGQQLLPSQDQPVMAPSQSQPLAFRAFNTPIQLPVQQPLQPAFQVPFQAPFVVPFQGMLPNALQVASGIPETEQSSSQPGAEAEEVQPKHTSINVNVAAKSTVPKKRSKKSKHPLHKRQFVPLTQGYVPTYSVPIPYNGGTVLPSNRKPRVSINVQTAKKSAVEQVHNKRESISLLTRFPAMQVLPQTFKQNGILMPAFNTLPVNHKIKANGLLLEELQRQRKHQIPKTAKETITGHSKQISQRSNVNESSKIRKDRKKENAKKRQFYAVPQSPLAVQQYPLISHPNLHPKPRVSVNVEVSKRKSEFPRKNHGLLQLKGVKRKLRDREDHPLDKTTAKRQVYGIEQLPHMVHLPVVGTPLLSQIPLSSQRPRVSVHVETAKKKNKVLSQKEHRKDSANKEKRQIYGLSELPHEGLPVPIAGQGEALGYFPITERSPHVSVNVEASKRSDDDDDVIHKRQVLGLQPPLAQPVEQDQEPIAMINGEESLQSHEPEEVGLTQSPIQETEQFNSLPAGIHSNSEAAEQEQVEEESPDAVRPSQAALSENDYQRPRVSVHVESSKRSEDEREHKARKHITATSHTAPWKGSKRQLQQHELEREDYEPEEEATAANPADLLQEQRPRVSVHVDVAKKKHNVADIPSLKKIKNHVHKAKARHPVRRQITVPFNGGLNTIRGGPIQNTQFVMGRDQQENEQGARELPIPLQSQSEVPEQQQQQQQSVQQVIQPAAFLQPDQQQQQQQQQQFPAFQQVMLPVGHTMEEKTRPKVSISVQTTKSLISKTNDHAKSLSYHKEQPKDHKLRRQLFGTVPLLSSLGQSTLNGATKENGRSTVPQSTKDVPNHTQDGKTGGRSWKRQLYNYLGGQQEQQFVPTQSLESATDTQQQGQELPIQPIQTFQQDAGVQLTPVNLPQASLLQTSDQGSPQAYPTQLEVPENNQQASATPIQTVEPSASPDSPFQRPRVSINVQTAKSQVPKPTRMFQNHGLRDKAVSSKLNSGNGKETKKFKRQFDLLGGGVIERRRGPKFVGGPLKKQRPENLFGLGNNLNKPVEVFADPISNLVGGGGAGRKRPKLGGIRLDSPTGVGALPLKGAATALEGALPPDLGAATILQDSPTEAAAPFAQDAGITNAPLFRPPSGMAGPQLDALEREGEGANNVPLNDLPSIRPAILPLPSINRAFLPNLPIPPAAPPLENPLLSPRILPIGPILPIAPPVAIPPPLQETAPPEVPQVPPRLAPILPPMFPMPLPSMAPDSALTNPDSLLPGPGDDKPSVHVNVETSRSSVPETEHHSKQHAKGQADRG